VLGRQGGDGWRPRCEWWVWIVFVIELQYFRRLTTAKARREYQPEINSGGHATASDAITIGYHTLLDGRRTEHREKVAKPPMRCRLVTLHEPGCPKDQRPSTDTCYVTGAAASFSKEGQNLVVV